MRELTGRSRGISWERRLEELNAYLRGWVNYFGLCMTKRLWSPLDEWVRRRLRMCLWKQWRTPPRSAVARPRDATEHGVANRVERERILAFVENAGDPHRPDERVVRPPGFGAAQVCLGRSGSAATNRLVRTRMLGGVGAGGENPPATRLAASHGVSLSEPERIR